MIYFYKRGKVGIKRGKSLCSCRFSFEKAVCMAVAAAIGVTVGFAFLRGAVRRAAIRSARKSRR